ncbi:hypothetical protein [Paenibacillus ehimensis]|uniref:Uncharacterized protein n=1 Tax=Paenibacillus ehimensis TaxID=79264 RepID=A0ABT8V514_9BACL|nr:hypothetical protein [Paenibacillus ehimensis]MDO3676509.1 hypothetical protein [Paenibacillus ehimensis]MEC0208365.1 hypothetical protein [Paenibacillus ehimensis]
MNVMLVLLATAAIVAIEWRSLMKRRQKRELLTFFLLCLLGTSLGIAEALQLGIPNPLDWITALYKPLSNLIYGSSA